MPGLLILGRVGAVAAVDADGKSPLFGRDGVTPLIFDEWVTRQAAEAPHHFESWRAAVPSVNHKVTDAFLEKTQFRRDKMSSSCHTPA